MGIRIKTMFTGVTTFRTNLCRLLSCASAFAVVFTGDVTLARAQGFSSTFSSLGGQPTLVLVVTFLAVIVFFWAFIAVRKMVRDQYIDKIRIAELETELNEAEAALTAEPNILIIWRGRETVPERILGDMRSTAKVPQSHQQLLNFDGWLVRESVSALEQALQTMRATGTPFNIGVKTKDTELLEADGRAAGGLATLRLRPLAGERRQTMELTYDTRKLGKQVERLSAVLDSAPFAVWLKNDDGEIQWVNQRYLQAVEAVNIDDIRDRRLQLVDPTKIEFDASDDPQATRRGDAHAVIAGQNRALEIHDTRLKQGTAGFAIDMTLLEETQKELKRHIRAHAGTLDKLATAIAIYGPDKRLRFYNSAFCELWNLDSDWLDTNPSDGEVLDKLRADRRLPEQANYRDWKEEQLASYTTIDARESWWHLPDGQALRVVAEQHPFGGVTYLYENVTEKFKLETRYNELIGVQRETLDNLHEGVALFGTNGCLRLYNPSYARFWKLEGKFLNTHPHIDMVIEKCSELYDDNNIWDELKYCVTELSENRQPLQGRLTRPDGMVFDFASVPLPDGNTLLTYVDMTASSGIERALRERNEALEAADRLKTNFLSNVSYELRTPLTNIIGFAEGLSIGIAGELQPKQHEYINHIQSSSGDLLAIIDAILDLTTIDAGAMELQLSEIDVPQLLQDIASEAASRIKRRDLTLNVELAEDATQFVGDDKRVRQILSNLLSNAVGFSAGGATVRMGARRDNNDILLWVADTGKGMDDEFQERAFDRFQSRPVAGGHRGPGLGLAIVKAFVELHGGKVSLLSKVDHGTTVICRFPITSAKAAIQRIEPAPSKRTTAG
ncbi:MAG: ATP-binding protein [Hyphomicrobiales bacterium]|nr:ATP-binding protein [Hyphomicrobiales bacterium]